MLEFCRRGTLCPTQLVLGIDRDLPYALRQEAAFYRPLAALAAQVHAGGRCVPLSEARARAPAAWAAVAPAGAGGGGCGGDDAALASAGGGGGGAACASGRAAPDRAALARLFEAHQDDGGAGAGGSAAARDAQQRPKAMWLYVNHLGWCRGPFDGARLARAHLCGRLPRDTLVAGIEAGTPVYLLSGDMAAWFRPLGALLANVANGYSYTLITRRAALARASAAAAGAGAGAGAQPAWAPLAWRRAGAAAPPLVDAERLGPVRQLPCAPRRQALPPEVQRQLLAAGLGIAGAGASGGVSADTGDGWPLDAAQAGGGAVAAARQTLSAAPGGAPLGALLGGGQYAALPPPHHRHLQQPPPLQPQQQHQLFATDVATGALVQLTAYHPHPAAAFDSSGSAGAPLQFAGADGAALQAAGPLPPGLGGGAGGPQALVGDDALLYAAAGHQLAPAALLPAPAAGALGAVTLLQAPQAQPQAQPQPPMLQLQLAQQQAQLQQLQSWGLQAPSGAGAGDALTGGAFPLQFPSDFNPY